MVAPFVLTVKVGQRTVQEVQLINASGPAIKGDSVTRRKHRAVC